MKLNTIIKLPDGRIGTICYHHLDGTGGVFGEQSFAMPDSGFGDELPMPEFMLREKRVERLVCSDKPGCVCVGEEYVVVQEGGSR